VRARISLAEAAEARKLSCEEVRLELGEVAEGLVKIGAPARRHVRDCERCHDFKKHLKANNHALAAIFPVGPLLLFKKLILTKLGSTASAGSAHVAGGAGATAGATAAGTAAAGAAGAGGASAAGGILTAGAGALATKAVAGLAAAALVTAGAVATQHTGQQARHHRHHRPVQQPGRHRHPQLGDDRIARMADHDPVPTFRHRRQGVQRQGAETRRWAGEPGHRRQNDAGRLAAGEQVPQPVLHEDAVVRSAGMREQRRERQQTNRSHNQARTDRPDPSGGFKIRSTVRTAPSAPRPSP